MKKLIFYFFLFFQAIALCHAILREELGKDLPTNYNNEDILARIRRPLGGGGAGGGSGCNFNGIRGVKPKSFGQARTFFDLQFINVGYNHNCNINCEGSGNHPGTQSTGLLGLGGHKPLLGNGGGQGHGGQGGLGGHGGQGGLFSNKPSKPILSMILANRPLQGLFSQFQSQTQTQTQTGILGDTISGLTSLLPKPHDVGQGLGEGISSFIQTIPQIGQSFQSLLPSFDNFQLPSLPSLPPLGQGSQSTAISGSIPSPNPPPNVVTHTPLDPVTEPTVDPDDIIYNDDIKPVHEDPDAVTGPHNTNKLPPGAYFNRNYRQNRYQSYKNYRDQKISAQVNRNKYHYQQSRPVYGIREPRIRSDLDIYSENERDSDGFFRERQRSTGFRFPT